MNAKLMLERESFYEILQKSVEEYISVVQGEEVAFTTERSALKEKMRLYLQPTFLASGIPCKGIREALYGEYNVRGNFLKFIAGKALVFFVTHSFGVTAKMNFYTDINQKTLKQLMISPCNRSIRFFHYDKGYVDCIVKNGYSNKYLQNQLQFRLENAKYEFIPTVSEYGDRWYREDILHGNPLIRIRNDRDFVEGQKMALADMGQIAKDTLKYQSAEEYIGALLSAIDELLQNYDNCEVLADACRKLNEQTKNLPGFDTLRIPTAETHGDLQGGNIWFTTDRKILIYDWETQKRRSVWFDPATLYWRLHSTPFNLDYENLAKTDERYLCNDENQNYTDDQKKIIARILYLENIAFYLDDIAQLPKEYAGDNFHKISESICNDLQNIGALK